MPTFKPNTLEIVKEFLEKTRKRLHDENPDYADMDEEQDPEGLDTEFGEGDEDEAAKWLETHDTAPTGEEGPTEEDPVDSEAVSEEEEPVAVPPTKREPKRMTVPSAAAPVSDEPTKEELASLREYTRPWEQHARDRAKLQAEAHVNPVRHHQGRLVEARNTSHADKQKAYKDLENSDEFKNADPITQMEMESKFHDDWNKQNPDHLVNALNAHHEAHKKGGQAKQAFAQAKDEKIRHIASGGAQPGSMSAEEGTQHVGGSRDDEDSGPSGIQQDKGAAFAGANQEFIQQYMQNYDKKAKKFTNTEDMNYADPEVRADVNSVLGDLPAFKDPAKKRQHDQFVAKYHPLIGKAAYQVLTKLGLKEKADSGQIDHGLLHEAGMHALYQAINDYDHDHPSKAKFTTHLKGKMHGLMQSALKASQTDVPETMRSGAKQFDKQKRAENAAPVKHTTFKDGQAITNIIKPATPKKSVQEIAAAHHPDIQDRLKRVVAAKAPVVRKQAAKQKPVAPKMNVNHMNLDEGGEE